MGIPLALITGTGALNHPRLKAQTTRWHTFLPYFLKESFSQSWSLPNRRLHQTPLAALENVDGMHKADLVWVPVGLQSGQIHQGAYSKVSQKQPIDLLFNPGRCLRAQGACRQTQVCFDLINALLNFPALVIEPNKGIHWVLLGINQGREQANGVTQFPRLGILHAVFNDSGCHGLALMSDLDQITAIMQTHPWPFVACAIEPSQHMSTH